MKIFIIEISSNTEVLTECWKLVGRRVRIWTSKNPDRIRLGGGLGPTSARVVCVNKYLYLR